MRFFKVLQGQQPEIIDSYEKAVNFFQQHYDKILLFLKEDKDSYQTFIAAMGTFKNDLFKNLDISISKQDFDKELQRLLNSKKKEDSELIEILNDFNNQYTKIKFENLIVKNSAPISQSTVVEAKKSILPKIDSLENPKLMVEELEKLQDKKSPYENITTEDREEAGIKIAKKLFGLENSINNNSTQNNPEIHQMSWLETAKIESKKKSFWLNSEVYSLIVKNTKLESFFWECFSQNLNIYKLDIYPSVNLAKEILFKKQIQDANIVTYLLNFLKKEKKQTITCDEYFKIFINIYLKGQELDLSYLNLAANMGSMVATLINEFLEKIVRFDFGLQSVTSGKNKIFKENKVDILKIARKLYFELPKLNLTLSQRTSLFAIISKELTAVHKDSKYQDINRLLADYSLKVMINLQQYTDVYDMYTAIHANEKDRTSISKEKPILLSLLEAIAQTDGSGRADYLLSRYYSEHKSGTDNKEKYAKKFMKYDQQAVEKNHPLGLLDKISHFSQEGSLKDQVLNNPSLLNNSEIWLLADFFIDKINISENIKHKYTILLLYFFNIDHLNAYRTVSFISSKNIRSQDAIAFKSLLDAYKVAANSKNLDERIAALMYLRSRVESQKGRNTPKEEATQNSDSGYYYSQLLLEESKNTKNNPEVNRLLLKQFNTFQILNFSAIEDGITLYNAVKNGDKDISSNNNQNKKASLVLPSMPPEDVEEILTDIINRIKSKVEETRNVVGALWLTNLVKKKKSIYQTDKEWTEDFFKWHKIAYDARHPEALVNELWCIGKGMHHHAQIKDGDKYSKGKPVAHMLFSMEDASNADSIFTYKKEWIRQAVEFEELFWFDNFVYTKMKNDQLKKSFWIRFVAYLDIYDRLRIFPDENIAKELLLSHTMQDKQIVERLLKTENLKITSNDYFQIFLNIYSKTEDYTYYNKAINGNCELAQLIRGILDSCLKGKDLLEKPSQKFLEYKKNLLERTVLLFFRIKELTLSSHKQTLFKFLRNEINSEGGILHNKSKYPNEIKELATFFLKMLEILENRDNLLSILEALTYSKEVKEKEILLDLLEKIVEIDQTGNAHHLLYKYYLNKISNNNQNIDLILNDHFQKPFKNKPLAEVDRLILLSENITLDIVDSFVAYLQKNNIKINLTAAEYFKIAIHLSQKSKLSESNYFNQSIRLECGLSELILDLFDVIKKSNPQLQSNKQKNTIELNENKILETEILISEIIQLIGKIFIEFEKFDFKSKILVSIDNEINQTPGNAELKSRVKFFLSIILQSLNLVPIYDILMSNNKSLSYSTKNDVLKLLKSIAAHDKTGGINYILFKYFQGQSKNTNNNSNNENEFIDYHRSAVESGFPLALVQELILITDNHPDADTSYLKKAKEIYNQIIKTDLSFSYLTIYLTSIKNFGFYLKFSELSFAGCQMDEETAYKKVTDLNAILEVRLLSLYRLLDQMNELKSAAAPYYLAKILMDQKNIFSKNSSLIPGEINSKINEFQELSLKHDFAPAIIEKMNTLVEQLYQTVYRSPTNTVKVLSEWLHYAEKLPSTEKSYEPFQKKLIEKVPELIKKYWEILNDKKSPDYEVALKELTEINKVVTAWQKTNFVVNPMVKQIIDKWSEIANEYPETDRLIEKYKNFSKIKEIIDKNDDKSTLQSSSKGGESVIKNLRNAINKVSLTEDTLDQFFTEVINELHKSGNDKTSSVPFSLNGDPNLQNIWSELKKLAENSTNNQSYQAVI